MGFLWQIYDYIILYYPRFSMTSGKEALRKTSNTLQMDNVKLYNVAMFTEYQYARFTADTWMHHM